MKVLLFDNYDSFTWNIKDYLEQAGATCELVRNDSHSIEELSRKTFEAIVISPGPKAPQDTYNLMPLIDTFHQSHPILGICLGYQALGMYYGANLTRADIPVHGKTSAIYHDGHSFFKGMPSPFKATRYHSLMLEDFNRTPLKVIAKTKKGQPMAFTHNHLPISGVQFHPEAILTEHGHQLLKNWLSMSQLHAKL